MGYAGYEEQVELSNLGTRAIQVREYTPQRSEADRQAVCRRLERQLYSIYHAFAHGQVGSDSHIDV